MIPKIEKERIGELEELIDVLRESKGSVAHNVIELNVVIDNIIDYQNEYKGLTGHYYSPSKTDIL